MGRSMQGFEDMQRRRAAAAGGISGLGQQGYNMLTGQIGLLDRLGQTGRGIQDTAFGNQYQAATQMADEPFMRMQRAMALMGGLGAYLPSYQTGYGSSQAPIAGSRGPSGFGQFAGNVGTGLTLVDQFLNLGRDRDRDN